MSVPRDWENDAKALALQKLDIWEQMAVEQYHARHYLVSFGKVVRMFNAETRAWDYVEDRGPKLQRSTVS